MTSLDNIIKDPFFEKFYFKLGILFVFLTLLSLATWYGYGEIQKQLEAQERPKIQKLNNLRSQVKFLQQQVRLYYEYGDKYQELVEKGLVNQQDRVFWTDSLIGIKDEFLIPGMTFSFSPEKSLNSSRFKNIKIPNGMFYYSELSLKMSLQHEEDLVRIFESISQNITPLYLVQGCKTNLKSQGHEVNASFDLTSGNVNVDCTLILFHTHKNENTQARR